jgi:hypothetical protein
LRLFILAGENLNSTLKACENGLNTLCSLVGYPGEVKTQIEEKEGRYQPQGVGAGECIIASSSMVASRQMLIL